MRGSVATEHLEQSEQSPVMWGEFNDGRANTRLAQGTFDKNCIGTAVQYKEFVQTRNNQRKILGNEVNALTQYYSGLAMGADDARCSRAIATCANDFQ